VKARKQIMRSSEDRAERMDKQNENSLKLMPLLLRVRGRMKLPERRESAIELGGTLHQGNKEEGPKEKRFDGENGFSRQGKSE